jgi:hypothetical protein
MKAIRRTIVAVACFSMLCGFGSPMSAQARGVARPSRGSGAQRPTVRTSPSQNRRTPDARSPRPFSGQAPAMSTQPTQNNIAPVRPTVSRIAPAVRRTNVGRHQVLDSGIVQSDTPNSGTDVAQDAQQDTAAPGIVLTLLNPIETGQAVNYTLASDPNSLDAGYKAELAIDGTVEIAFDRGGSFGEARYTLSAGQTYRFASTNEGWALRTVATTVAAN